MLLELVVLIETRFEPRLAGLALFTIGYETDWSAQFWVGDFLLIETDEPCIPKAYTSFVARSVEMVGYPVEPEKTGVGLVTHDVHDARYAYPTVPSLFRYTTWTPELESATAENS